MTVYFFDSSALVKRYIAEVGTGWVTRIVNPVAGNRIYVVRITGVEVVAAITRRGRSGARTPSGVALTTAQFRHEFANLYRMVEVTPTLLTKAMDLAEIHALRGYDALQLAAALHLNAQRLVQRKSVLTLVSADARLNSAATAEGLLMDDPNAHP